MNIPLVAVGAILAACLSQNPIGVPVQPCQYSVYDASGTGSTVVVEERDSTGLSVALEDTNGVSWPAAVLTLGAHASESVGWGITQYKPDGTHPLVAPTTGQVLTMRVTVGQVTVNASGTYDSSVGTGNGIATGRVAPNANSPTLMLVGDVWKFGGGQ